MSEKVNPCVLLLKSFAAWLLILVLAVLNGVFREAVLLPNLCKPAAFVLSGLMLSLCIVGVAVALARWLELGAPKRRAFVGCFWLGLTLFFEFGFGGLVRGKSWQEMLEAYTFKDGNLWPIVLIITFLAPFVAARIVLRRAGRSNDNA